LLKESCKSYIDPKFLVENLKTFEGTPINVAEQMDVDEFLINFFDTLEAELKAIDAHQILERCFIGELYQEIKGLECDHINIKTDKFLAITVPVNEINNLNEGLKNFTKWEILDGADAYFCGTCNAKVRAQKRIMFNKLPNILIITLKRFEFDYQNK